MSADESWPTELSEEWVARGRPEPPGDDRVATARANRAGRLQQRERADRREALRRSGRIDQAARRARLALYFMIGIGLGALLLVGAGLGPR